MCGLASVASDPGLRAHVSSMARAYAREVGQNWAADGKALQASRDVTFWPRSQHVRTGATARSRDSGSVGRSSSLTAASSRDSINDRRSSFGCPSTCSAPCCMGIGRVSRDSGGNDADAAVCDGGARDSEQVAESNNGAKVVARRPMVCPTLRQRGVCNIPSCPYIHEVGKARRIADGPIGHRMPWVVVQPTEKVNCSDVPCRFFALLGRCSDGDFCVYSHETKTRRPSSASAARACAEVPKDTPSESKTKPLVSSSASSSCTDTPNNGPVVFRQTARPRPRSAATTRASSSQRGSRRHVDVFSCGLEVRKQSVLGGWGDTMGTAGKLGF
eukprot:TRINITY_DN55673_c0_g1_i1.p1 TRINITY_DN55673_c0_g1~~TRINITY_DN55673_c0_g1_i1.p1  ORF type:complete len:330 (-),score=39.51 TRINITY_DN55673_c0_g1_i1:273-1262(-)